MRAVINAGEHNQRASRRKPEGDRKQHCDSRDRANAGQNPDQRADERADQAIDHVHRDGDRDYPEIEKGDLEDDAEAQREISQELIHAATS